MSDNWLKFCRAVAIVLLVISGTFGVFMLNELLNHSIREILTFVITAAVFILAPAVGGTSIFRHTSQKLNDRSVDAKIKRAVSTARNNDGLISTSSLVLKGGFSLRKAKEVVELLQQEGFVEPDVDSSGNFIYKLTE